MKAAPLELAKVKITVKNTVCESLRRQHTAFLNVNLTLTRTSGAALKAFIEIHRGEQPHAGVSQSKLNQIRRIRRPGRHGTANEQRF